MINEIRTYWKNNDLYLIPTFETDEDIFVTDDFAFDEKLIKQMSIQYMRLHYKIDPVILGMEFFEWDFNDN